VNGLLGWFGLKRDSGAGDAVLLIAREVTDRVQSVQSALAEIRQPEILGSLTERDFDGLDQVIAEQADDDREYAIVLARLVYAAAKAKGFDVQVVDAALRLDSLLPGEDPARERERLLHDAWALSERIGYPDGGREALHRLGMRALDSGETERAKQTLRQQLTTGDETADGPAEVAAALALGDRLRREGQRQEAQELYRRVGRAAQRLGDPHAIAEALSRQIELLPENTDLATLAALQRQAMEAARRTADLGLQSRLVLSLAGTLQRNGKTDEAAAQLEQGLAIANQIGDLALEVRCRTALAEIESGRRRTAAVASQEQALLALEERLGNRSAASDWATALGTSLLELGDAGGAIDAFSRGAELAAATGDARREERALGGLGIALTHAGRAGDALESLMRALALSRQSGDAAGEARWLTSIGESLWRFGQLEDASRAFSDALSIARKNDDLELQASLLVLIGRLFAARGQGPRAREALTRALEMQRRVGQESGAANLPALAALAVETGQANVATQLYEQALSAALRGGDRGAAARLHLRLGRLQNRRGDVPAALDQLRQAADQAAASSQPALLTQALQLRATTLHAAGMPEAIEAYLEAIEQCRVFGDVSCEALMAVDLGFCLASSGRTDEAAEALREGIAIARQQGGPEGAELVARADEALSALAEVRFGALASRPALPRAVETELPVPVVDDPLDRDDELFREATLPPG
jgi:tetratricopeptide (TPR) repeat protein